MDKSCIELCRISKSQMIKYIRYKKELKRHHKELRKEGLKELKVIRSEKGQTNDAKIIQKIANCEMKQSDWAIVKNTLRPRVKSGISTVEVPNLGVDGLPTDDPEKAVSWKRLTNPIDIEERLLDRNVKHFGQAEGTLFTTNDIMKHFEYEGTTSDVQCLLEGNLEIDNENEATTGAITLMNKLSNKPEMNHFEDDISFLEFRKALRKWKENTSTSPSGRHLGHYKCLLDADHCEDKYDDVHKDPRDDILKVYYNLIISALNSGSSMAIWQNCTTTMIEKQPGCSRINKLRVIHLYEADYNIILKIIWARKLVWHAHDNELLNMGQARSRPGMNAIDVVIQKDQTYTYSRLTKTNLATMDNDAKSCYDRIIVNLAMITSQYFGVSKETAAVQAKTLHKMQYPLRTAIGDSKNTYQHSPTTPIHGTGQGSCSSPSIWLMLSSILMDCLSELSGGMTMIDVINETTIQQWIDGFVDDTSLFSNILQYSDDNDIQQLIQQLQQDMMHWKELLESSGGKLELTNCFYYLLSWKFDVERNALPMTIQEQRQSCEQISVCDSNGQNNIMIQQKEVYTAHKTLGCYKAIDGNEIEQIKYLKTKSDAYGQSFKNAQLSRKQAKMAYRMVYISSLKYGLPACSLTVEQILHIQSSTIDKFLPFMGFEHGSKRLLIHGPKEMGGAGIPHLYTEMMGLKLESFISHIRADTILGKPFRINLNYIQLIAGTETPIFESSEDLGYVPDNWILHLRNFICEINGSLKINDTWTPQKLRDNDLNLMTAFKSLQLFTIKEINLINN